MGREREKGAPVGFWHWGEPQAAASQQLCTVSLQMSTELIHVQYGYGCCVRGCICGLWCCAGLHDGDCILAQNFVNWAPFCTAVLSCCISTSLLVSSAYLPLPHPMTFLNDLASKGNTRKSDRSLVTKSEMSPLFHKCGPLKVVSLHFCESYYNINCSIAFRINGKFTFSPELSYKK